MFIELMFTSITCVPLLCITCPLCNANIICNVNIIYHCLSKVSNLILSNITEHTGRDIICYLQLGLNIYISIYLNKLNI